MKADAHDNLLNEMVRLKGQLDEANDTLDAIRTGQIDALVVNGENGHALYTLKTADHAYRVFIEQMTEGAVTLNSSGLIIYSNSQFARMVGRNLAHVLGSEFSSYVSAECITAFSELFEKGWRENAKREITIRAEEVEIPVLLSLNALQLEEEVALSLIVTDLTVQKAIERQLRESNVQLENLNKALVSSNHDLQQFASVASHDLQEPLRKIQVFSKFLKDRNFDELAEEPRQYVEKIILSSQRMKVLIIDILNYSRLSAVDGHFQSVNLNGLFDEIKDDFELKITEKNAKIEIECLPSIEGNKGQLRQVFQNLVSNALKFTSPARDPHIVVKTKELNAKQLGVSLPNDETYCNISIRDNGIGFDEQFATSIFSLFEKLNPKSTFEGSGIGLAIAKKIVDKHRGLIIAKSQVGEGAEFNILLPYRQQK